MKFYLAANDALCGTDTLSEGGGGCGIQFPSFFLAFFSSAKESRGLL